MSSSLSFIDEVEEEFASEAPSFIEEVEADFSSGKEKLKEVGKQVGIGGVRGVGAYGNILDLLRAQPKERLLPGQKALAQAEFEAPESLLPFLQDDDLLPHYSRLPSGEEMEDFLQILGVDTEPYTEAGKTARRIGEGGVGAGMFGPIPALIGAGLVGGAVGGLTEELTGSPLAGDVAEITTNIGALLKKGPTALGKRGAHLRKLQALGFSPQEATLLSQGKGKLGFLGKLASKDSKMDDLFKKIFQKHSNLYDGLRATSKELGYLSGSKGEKLTEGIFKALDDLTPGQQEIVSKLVENFQSKPVTFKSMMDFIHDLNMKFGTVQGGKKAVLKLKQPVLEAMKDLSPEAGQVFDELQASYGNAKRIGKKLKPGVLNEILEAGELLSLAKGMFDAKGGLIVKAVGATGARKLAREFLINPDLQGLMVRIARATKEGKTLLAQNLAKKLPKYLPKENES